MHLLPGGPLRLAHVCASAGVSKPRRAITVAHARAHTDVTVHKDAPDDSNKSFD